MININNITIIGNLVANPEKRALPSGTVVCNFTVAHNESWKDSSGQKHERAHFFPVVCYAGLAEVCEEHLEKGQQVCVLGSLRQEKWEKDGQKHSRLVIKANEVQFGRKSQQSNQ